MAVYTGYGGSVKVGTNTVAELGEWSLDINADTQDTTSLGSTGWRSYVVTLKNWSGSASGRWDMTDTNGQKALQDALLGGTTVTLNLYIDSTKRYSGTAVITKVSVSTSADGVAEVSFDFQGTGALTYSAS